MTFYVVALVDAQARIAIFGTILKLHFQFAAFANENSIDHLGCIGAEAICAYPTMLDKFSAEIAVCRGFLSFEEFYSVGHHALDAIDVVIGDSLAEMALSGFGLSLFLCKYTINKCGSLGSGAAFADLFPFSIFTAELALVADIHLAE